MSTPFNISVMDPEEYIQRKGLLPITSHAIFEGSTGRFHPDGFFSEAIFGQVGSKDRLVRRGYIDLRTTVITPHLYNLLIGMKGYYKDILAGKTYATFDPKLRDFVKTTMEDPDGDTGYSFFLSHIHDIQYAQSDSQKRADKIKLLEMYQDRLLIKKFVVLPAGVRDIKIDEGRVTPEEINKLYMGLLSLVQALPETGAEDKVFDAIRFQIQNKMQQIYAYIFNQMDGKGGFLQSRFTSRAVVYANRNVITALPHSRVSSPEAKNQFGADEVIVPLFQAMKAAVPLVVFRLRKVFFDRIFSSQTSQVPLIDPETKKLGYHEVASSELHKFTTSEGIEDLINAYRDVDTHWLPAAVKCKDGKERYLEWVYDNGDEIYTFRNVDDFTLFYSHAHRYTDNLSSLDAIENPEKCVIIGTTALKMLGMEVEPEDLDVLAEENIPGTDTYKVDDIATVIKEQSIQIGRYHVASIELLNALYKEYKRPKDAAAKKFLTSITYDETKLRPMSWTEMYYLATYSAIHDKHATYVRHPVLLIENVMCAHIHLMSTVPGRIVTLRLMQENDPGNIVLPEYPVPGREVKSSMSVHTSALPKLAGDHDGDVLGLNILMSDEANEEIEEFLNSPLSMISADHRLTAGLDSDRICKMTIFAATYAALPDQK